MKQTNKHGQDITVVLLIQKVLQWWHMGIMASQITGKSIVDQQLVQAYNKNIKKSSFSALPPVDSLHKWLIMRKTFSSHDIITIFAFPV